ncbi:methionine synthase [Peptococcaceae bacterium CEB3]|nr:methionine synthase [Peptococcaceae bacterium CEB3]
MSFEKIIDAITEGEAEDTLELTKQALAQGYPAKAVLEKGLLVGINGVAEKFREARVNVPEVLMAARAMHAGLSVIEPLLVVPVRRGFGKIVVGTVAGDLHDVGISLVKTMAMSTGASIIDLGVDVTPKKFANVTRREKPDILMISALLTTTMTVMRSVIEELEAQGLRKEVKIIVGGAPVTEDFAKEIGADYYFEDCFRVRDFLEENLSKIVTAR